MDLGLAEPCETARLKPEVHEWSIRLGVVSPHIVAHVHQSNESDCGRAADATSSLPVPVDNLLWIHVLSPVKLFNCRIVHPRPRSRMSVGYPNSVIDPNNTDVIKSTQTFLLDWASGLVFRIFE
jgi:hypothetical protein